jgi:hypothetical protein
MIGPVTTSGEFRTSAALAEGAGGVATTGGGVAGTEDAAFVVDGAIGWSSLQAASRNIPSVKVMGKLRILDILTNPSNPKS